MDVDTICVSSNSREYTRDCKSLNFVELIPPCNYALASNSDAKSRMKQKSNKYV